jgi:uncharacterized Zn finger protein
MERKRRRISKERSGIRVRTEFDGSHWWTEEWLNHINRLSVNPKQITAARNCAKAGNVLEVNLETCAIESSVRGRAKSTYHVRLYCELPTAEQLDGLKRRLSEKAGVGALLLSGKLPRDVGEAFASEGIALLPNDFVKSRRFCSCSDQGTVCKHILAVLFVMADVIDRDPLSLLKLRGLGRDDLLSSLLAPRNRVVDPSRLTEWGTLEPSACETMDEDGAREGPIPLNAAFFGAPELPAALVDFWNSPPECASFPDPHTPLFSFPFWKGETTFSDSIEPYYESVRKTLRGA